MNALAGLLVALTIVLSGLILAALAEIGTLPKGWHVAVLSWGGRA